MSGSDPKRSLRSMASAAMRHRLRDMNQDEALVLADVLWRRMEEPPTGVLTPEDPLAVVAAELRRLRRS